MALASCLRSCLRSCHRNADRGNERLRLKATRSVVDFGGSEPAGLASSNHLFPSKVDRGRARSREGEAIQRPLSPPVCVLSPFLSSPKIERGRALPARAIQRPLSPPVCVLSPFLSPPRRSCVLEPSIPVKSRSREGEIEGGRGDSAAFEPAGLRPLAISILA